MRIGFIGAGKVGCTLGKFFSNNGIQVTGYYSLHRESAEEAADFTGSKVYDDRQLLVKESDAIFITVSDQAITSVYEEIKNMGIQDKQICHCSGAMTAREAFPDIDDYGAFGYAIHPLFPISSKTTSYRELTGAFFCLEGEGPHCNWWELNLKKMGVTPKWIDSNAKVSYHAACAISSNLVIALLTESVELLEECGFSNEEALSALKPLAVANVKRALTEGPESALTGPVERGDAITIEKHLNCLQSDEERLLYRAASRKILKVAKSKNPDKEYDIVERILEERD